MNSAVDEKGDDRRMQVLQVTFQFADPSFDIRYSGVRLALAGVIGPVIDDNAAVVLMSTDRLHRILFGSNGAAMGAALAMIPTSPR